MSLRNVSTGCAFFMTFSLWVPAAAQEYSIAGAEERPEVVNTLFSCKDRSDTKARLACFDSAVDAMRTAEADNDLVFVDREQVREARRGLFGFSLPKIRLFGGGDANDEGSRDVREIEEPLANFGSTPAGKVSFTLQSGARWVQTDNVPVLGRPKPGEIVRIEQAALGSYKASINGRRAIKIKRVD